MSRPSSSSASLEATDEPETDVCRAAPLLGDLAASREGAVSRKGLLPARASMWLAGALALALAGLGAGLKEWRM